MKEKRIFTAGDAIEFPYPFIRGEFDKWDEEGSYKVLSWQPGVRYEENGYSGTVTIADGIGKQMVNVISIHKPGRFPERVFFTRRWETPDGIIFGKKHLRMKTTQVFRKLVAGYEYEYELAKQ